MTMAGERMHPIAIVGMAGVFPGATNVATFWSNILAGVDATGPVPADRIDPVFFHPSGSGPDRFYCDRGGFIPSAVHFDPAEFGIMPVAAAEAEPDQLLALATATRALADAGFVEGGIDPERSGVILGRGGYITPAIARLEQRVRTSQQLIECLQELLPGLGPDQLDAVRQRFQDALGPTHPESSIGLVPSLAASRVANRLDLRGPAYTIDAACASSLIAVAHAVTELASGRCDVMLAGGVHHCHDLTLWSVFSQLRALSRSGRLRAFDRRADGILVGEGTGIVVLKRLADAEQAGDRIYAVLRGVGIASDGRTATLMNPSVDGQVLAIELAWQAADLDPATVDLIEAHGTGTPAGDSAEIATLRRVFNGGAPVGLGSVKSMIGHAMPASGIAGLIKAALAVFHGVWPPTLHCDEPHPDLAGSRFRLPGDVEAWPHDDGRPRRAGVNAFGFGGINAHVVLESHTAVAWRRQPPPTSWAQPSAGPTTRLFAHAGDDLAEVAAQLDDEARVLAGTPLPDVAGRGPVRLAIADPTPKRVALARKVVDRGLPWRGRNDVWFSPEGLIGRGGKIAYAFPGVEPGFAPELEDVASHFRLDQPDIPVATEIGRHGAGIIRVGRLLVGALGRLGLEPDVIAGHSLGEWTAMIVSESVPEEAVDAFIGGLVAGQLVLPDLVFLAVGCSATTARELIADLPDIAVSHDNCPHQAIICGSEPSIAAAEERARSRRVLGQVLPFRTGFHTPMFAPYMGPFERCLGGLPLRSARIPLWSSITAQPFPSDTSGIHELAARLYVEPVQFRELVTNLYADGVRVFVQPGLGSVAGFVDDTLRNHEHLAIAAAVPNRAGLDQLLRVAAALWVEGAGVDFGALASVGRGTGLRFDLPLVRGSQTPVAQGVDRASYRGPFAEEVSTTLQMVVDASREIARAAQTIPQRRRFSVQDVPELVDHTFFRQPAGVGTMGDRYPVVPMTMIIGQFVEVARQLAPDRIVVGLERVRALRWLAVEPAVEVTIEASFDGPDRVQVAMDGYARAVVLLGDSYASPPDPDTAPLAGERPALHTAAQVYEQRWMFHGPAYQGITETHTMGSDGVRASVTALAAPGALLDAAGQLLGYWVIVNLTRDRTALPFRIDRIDFYGPPPEIGATLDCTVRMTAVTEADARGDIELVRGGRLWARLSGWTDRRFETTDPLLWVMLFPERNVLTERTERGWVVREHWHSRATRDLVMRRYLAEAERAEYLALPPPSQRRWLLGRIAVKDAVRSQLWERGAGPIYPLEVGLHANGHDGFVVSGPNGSRLSVELSHEGNEAVAAITSNAGA